MAGPFPTKMAALVINTSIHSCIATKKIWKVWSETLISDFKRAVENTVS